MIDYVILSYTKTGLSYYIYLWTDMKLMQPQFQHSELLGGFVDDFDFLQRFAEFNGIFEILEHVKSYIKQEKQH